MAKISQHSCISRRHSGFSLLELVIALGIIFLLYAIIAPVMFTARLRAGETACSSNLHQIHLALQMYKQDYGEYPHFRPPDQMTPAYITSPSLYICPLEYRKLSAVDPSDPGAQAKYPTSYFWPCIPTEDRDTAYERRGNNCR
jgi:type II secretory pathway pseudopilin PulG